MVIIEFNNLKNLNTSLQIGDAVYAHGVNEQIAGGLQQTNGDTGTTEFIGVLRKIETISSNHYKLHVDDDPTKHPFSNDNPYTGLYYLPKDNDFIMFSKFEQGDSGVLGYYAKARFVNDSKKKAELFAVSSEIIINSN